MFEQVRQEQTPEPNLKDNAIFFLLQEQFTSSYTNKVNDFSRVIQDYLGAL